MASRHASDRATAPGLVYREIYFGISPVVVASVYKFKLLKNSRKNNSFSKEPVGYLNYYLHYSLMATRN